MVAVNEMPNFTGVIARPRLTMALPAFHFPLRRDADDTRSMLPTAPRFVEQVVFHNLAIVRDIARFEAVKINLAHVERIHSERAGDVVEDPFDHHHSLRSAEAAKCRVRYRVRLATVRFDGDVFEKICIVHMRHRAIVDRTGEIGRVSAPRGEQHFERKQSTLLIEAHVVVGQEIVALAGDDHIEIAIEPKFHGTMSFMREHRDCRGQQSRLTFLAAKAAAHSAALNRYAVCGNVERVRDDGLHFGGMLRRTVNQHRAVFLWRAIAI